MNIQFEERTAFQLKLEGWKAKITPDALKDFYLSQLKKEDVEAEFGKNVKKKFWEFQAKMCLNAENVGSHAFHCCLQCYA